VSLVLFCLLIILILITLTLKIFSILIFKFFLLALFGTLNIILLYSDKLVDFSVTIGDKIDETDYQRIIRTLFSTGQFDDIQLRAEGNILYVT